MPWAARPTNDASGAEAQWAQWEAVPPDIAHFAEATALPPRNIGQFAGQGIPFIHCQDARGGNTIASNKNDSTKAISLRL